MSWPIRLPLTLLSSFFTHGARLAVFTLLTLAVGCAVHAEAQLQPVPALTGRVIDHTGTLSPDEAAALEGELAQFETKKGAQVIVLIIPTTAPETIEQYGVRVAQAWRIGRGRIDDGVVLIVARQDRTLRIEVGYGLEGVIPDAIAKRIIEDTILPHFRQGAFGDGLRAGVRAILSAIEEEPLQPVPPPKSRGTPTADFLPLIFSLALFSTVISAALRPLLGGFLSRIAASTVGGGLAYLLSGAVAAVIVVLLALFFFGGGFGGPRNGYYYGGRRRTPHPLGGFGFPGWGGGSGGGGGFSGGGGTFGGGGASGRW